MKLRKGLVITLLFPKGFGFAFKILLPIGGPSPSSGSRIVIKNGAVFSHPAEATRDSTENGDNISPFPNLLARYMNLSERRPLATQSISAGAISAVGDILAQFIEAKVSKTVFALNWIRLFAFWASGTLYVGPFVYLWYELLAKMGKWMESKHDSHKLTQTLAQVVVDQTVGVAFFFPPYFFVYELFAAGITGRAIDMAATYSKCVTQMAPVLIMNYRVWPLTTWILFAHVPQSLRVLVSSTIGVLWNAYLCTRVA